MPKCNRCPIRRECNKLGKITLKHKETGKTTKICPLLWAIDLLLQMQREIYGTSEQDGVDKK